MDLTPGYISLLKNGALDERVSLLKSRLSNCDICPRHCFVDRFIEKGKYCRTGAEPVVSSYGPHYGEEAPLVGRRGSGTIFFTNCNLKCIFCQNYDISHLGAGRQVSTDALAEMMLELQGMGCHNINLVSPTHVVPQFVEGLSIAARKGLNIPLVYNSGGYDSVETLQLLEGIVDIYMPDIKYSEPRNSEKYSGARDYFEICRKAIKEMHRQVGDLFIDDYGIARRGLLVRHLVLPNGLAGTEQVVRFISEEISKNTYINIMDQYRPCFNAFDYPEIRRSITSDEYDEALHFARKAGLSRFDGVVI